MANTKWTKEQLSAITTRGCNLLVAAAAGSGKTAVLVERIIRMITDEEKPVDIDRLLVVTFTSAAAGEMRERIGEAIAKALDKEPNSKVLQRQLTLLSRANITTMHSFCLDVIKNNFHYIDLDPNFRIGDDTECTLIKNDTILELFEDRYDNDDEEFKKLVDIYCDSKDDTALQALVLKLYEFSMSGPQPEKWLRDKCEELKISTVEDLNNSKWAQTLIASLVIDVQGYIRLLINGRNICSISGGLEPYIENFENDINQLEVLLEALKSGKLDKVYDAFNDVSFSKLKTVKKNTVESEEDQEKVKGIRDTVKKAISKLKGEIFYIQPQKAVEDFSKLYSVVNTLIGVVIEFIERYRGKKKDRGILDFSDLEHLCLKILIEKQEDGSISPSKVSQEFREKFNEVLVDEYQDTNNIQETIINMVSRKNTSDPNVFMVGDVKQSIYRFRNAKPELFLEKYNTYPNEDGYTSRKILLFKNFRSRKEIIEGVNFIFKSIMSETIGELHYDEKEALNLGADYEELTNDNIYLINEEIPMKNLKVAGDIELHILNKAGENDVDLEEQQMDDSEIKKDELDEEDLDAIQLEARIVMNRVKELLKPSDGSTYMVFDKGLGGYRPITFKDIVILLRATKGWSEVFVEELGREGIPVYADTGTGYFDTIEIRTILSLLHIIDNPLQDIHVLSVLRSPIFSFSSEELGDLRLINRENYFYENIVDIANESIECELDEGLRDKCKYFVECLDRWREKTKYTPVDELIWYLINDTSYYGYVGTMPNGIQRQANLRVLFQRAKVFEQTSFKGLFNFINFINKLRKSSNDMDTAKVLGENEDVIRIMSIHKSKGLEFPVVFLSGCGKQFNIMDLNNKILFHDELGFGPDLVDVDRRIKYSSFPKLAIRKKFNLETLSEEMRILYVAVTRAKEKLIITGATRDLEKSAEKWCSAASLHDRLIFPSEVMKGKCYLDWIAMAVAKHKDGELLRKIGGGDIKIINDDLSTWSIKEWRKSELIVDEKNEVVDKKTKDEELFIFNKGILIDEEIKRRLDFEYSYISLTTLPSNVSVSDLKHAGYEENNTGMISIYKEEVIKKPMFLQEEKGLSPTERGTVMHFVMQHINLDEVETVDKIKKQLDIMVIKELLTDKQLEAVKPVKIYKFFKSELGKRVIRCHKTIGKVYRELPFFTSIPIHLIDKELTDDKYKDENIRLQGIIDCFFEEDDEIILIDYKTDYVENGMEQEILDRYQLQIEYYSNTLERITGKKVREKYLYLFGLDREVKY